MKIKDLGELGLIKTVARKISVDGTVIKGIGDDAAVIRWKADKHLLFTCDMLIEDVHFKRDKATAFQIGWKAMARNVSDIAAMGGRPRYATVSAALDPELPAAFFDGILKGMISASRKFKFNIVGGDTARSGKIVIDISMIGEVDADNAVFRSGARPGDVIMVTGSIGGSIKLKHLNFTPRLKESQMLVKKYKINSMIDISDGLAIDLGRILLASGVGARIYESLIPVSPGAGAIAKAIGEGEDFELLFTMRALEARKLFKSGLNKIGTAVTLIGEVTDKKRGYLLVDGYGKEKDLKLGKGFLHF